MPRPRTPAALALLLALAACGPPSGTTVASEGNAAIAAENSAAQVQTVAEGLVHPWGMAFLPDGRMLVTERPGRLRYVSQDGTLSDPIGGVPPVYDEGQGGLLDVALDPDFASNRLVYLSYAQLGPQGRAGTAVARGQLDGQQIRNLEVIFSQDKVEGENHFGSRLAFGPDGKLFVTLGERFKFEPAQDLGNTLGTIVRINPDGTVPPDNPFVGREDAKPEIWSYGHRNIEAAAFGPDGRFWVAEMGPKGGDELNLIQPGRNYGWPLVSWGEHYDFSRGGGDIPDPPTRPDLAGSVHQWTPVISPSGMVFYSGGMFPDWQGDALIGGLTADGIVRVSLGPEGVAEERRIDLGARIREVAQGPDGAVYALTDEDSGKILRLTPGAR